MKQKTLFYLFFLAILMALAACSAAGENEPTAVLEPVVETITDTAVNEPTPIVPGDEWQDITGEYVTFQIPGAWQPTAVTPGMGSILAEWHLGIPGVDGDQTVAFFAVPFDELKPDDVVDADELLIGGSRGVKWVRRGEGYVSYDYYSPGTAVTQAAGAGSFGLHVTLPADDAELESILDRVVASIQFNAADCPEATAGAHQLIDAAQGICFLYPDNYDVFQSEDGSLALYVRSLLNTEAPLATVRLEALDGRTIQEVIPDYPSDMELATMSFLTIDLGGEQAMVLDNLPGQDINRRVIAVHDGRVVDIMVARIGEEYGEVGQQAEALYQMITETFQFIGIEPEAPLRAGPECPEPAAGTTLFTNAEDGYCLLLPDGYTVDDRLTANNDGTETAVYVESLMNVTRPRLFITVEEANGRTLDDITTEKAAEIETIIGSSPMWSFGYMLDGVPANQFDQAPGQDLSRQVVLVRDGRVYTLTFIPDDPEAEAYADLQLLYDTVMDSFSFLWQN